MLGNAISILGIGLVEVLDGTFQDVTGNALHGSCNSRDSVISHLAIEHLSEEGPCLTEIAVRMVRLVSCHQASHLVRLVLCISVEAEGVLSFVEAIGLVIGSTS